MTTQFDCISDDVLVSSTRQLVGKSLHTETDLLLHLGEVDARQLYRGMAYASMFTYCVGALRFSEGSAFQRLTVARLMRRFPLVADVLRSGKVHFAGLRVLAAHLTEDNCQAVLEEATGKTKRDIEELVARLAPKPPVPDSIRKTPVRTPAAVSAPAPVAELPLLAAPEAKPLPPVRVAPPPPAPRVVPLAEDSFKVQFTASARLRRKLEEARDLMGHSPSDLASLIEKAMDLLISNTKKRRFGIGAKPRKTTEPLEVVTESRHVPMAIRRVVYLRDKGRCTFVDNFGNRCAATRHLEFEHVDGFARTHVHSAADICLRCAAHNQYAAELLYGASFMKEARARAAAKRKEARTT